MLNQETYRGCLTSIFIFCFGVRSPWRMMAMTQRSSILNEAENHRHRPQRGDFRHGESESMFLDIKQDTWGNNTLTTLFNSILLILYNQRQCLHRYTVWYRGESSGVDLSFSGCSETLSTLLTMSFSGRTWFRRLLGRWGCLRLPSGWTRGCGTGGPTPSSPYSWRENVRSTPCYANYFYFYYSLKRCNL